ncbi:MAG: peptidase S9 [Melioribacteraceae bacterium]|nr:MAG: peptidase S9 [Melioribacteraceae bacterium]
MRQIILLFLSFSVLVFAQKKELTFDDIFSNPELISPSQSQVQWIEAGEAYTYLRYDLNSGENNIVKWSPGSAKMETVLEGSKVSARIGDESAGIKWYEWSPDERYILITNYLMPRYSKPGGDIIIYDTKEDYWHLLKEENSKQWVPGFTGDSKSVVFVKDDNLFRYNLETFETVQLTFDGDGNIINGHFDWVYQEELGAVKGWRASDQGNFIAFWRFDQKYVPEVKIAKWDSLYFNFLDIPYPKAGGENSSMTVGIINTDTREINWLAFNYDEEFYIPEITPVKGTSFFAIQKTNRIQNKLELLFYNPEHEEMFEMIEEKSEGWIKTDDNLRFIPEKKLFTWTSERSGYKHIYLYDYQGNLVKHLDIGPREVNEIEAIDFRFDKIFFTSNIRGTIFQDLYSVEFDGSNLKRLTEPKGYHDVSLSDNPNYFIDTYNSIHRLSLVTLYNITGEKLYTVKGSEKNILEDYNLRTPEFKSFLTKDSVGINMMLIKPYNFDASKKYPMLIYNYSGPGSQIVRDRWGGSSLLWHHYLANNGYVILYVDNRGTGGRGTDFKHVVYRQLGKYEVNDIAAAAEYMKTLGYIDENRIGIWGWSYGGYVSSLSLAMKPDLYKAAVSVAPVTDWHYYDNIYTERYMSLPELNQEGYKNGSVLTHAGNIKGDLLLIHGTADDNVHLQNSIKLSEKLIKEGVQFRMFYYPEKNHSIYGGNTRQHLFRMITDFITEKL